MKVNTHKLDLLLAERCLSLTELRSNGLSPMTLRRIRRGEDVKPKTMGKLARALGCDPVDIIAEE